MTKKEREQKRELALKVAQEVLDNWHAGKQLTLNDIVMADMNLRATLTDIDRFWVRWSYFLETTSVAMARLV